MIYVVETDHVDVVNMSIGGLPALNDGNNTRAVLYNRLIEDNDVQMFFSAGNDGPGVNTIGDPAVTSKAMGVGAYITKETWQRNYGSDANFVDNLHPFSSRGPAEDGAFKPNIVAPGAAISSTPTWQNGAAGRRDVHPPARLRDDERHVDGVASGHRRGGAADQRRQGAAPRDVLASLPAPDGDELDRAVHPRLHGERAGQRPDRRRQGVEPARNSLEPVNITSRVEVHTLLSDFLADPGHGPGIYDREGVTAGQSYTRTYTFTRTSGPNRPVLYHLRWVGNDGTFSTQNNVQLRPGVPTDVDVTVNPRTSGIHAAILQLDNSSTDGIDYETMNTVVAPDVFTAANGYTVTKTGMAGRNHVDRYFFRVPAGDPVLKVDLAGPDGNPGTGQVRFLRFHPWGLGVDSNASTSCYAPPVAGCATGDPLSRTVDGADEGVWEVTVEARRTSDTDWAPYTLTASLFGVAVTPNPDVIAEATGRRAGAAVVLVPEQLRVVHRAGGRLTARQRAERRVHDRQRRAAGVHDDDPGRLDVVPGDDRGPSDPAADLDLFVYQCTDRRARRARSGDRAPTETRRSRSRSRTRRPARGWCGSTASRSRQGRRRTTTSTSSPTRRSAR